MANEDIPEWAMTNARGVTRALGLVVVSGHVDPIALALVEAEKLGMERAAPALATAEQALKDWLHDYTPELCDPEHVKEARARIGAHGTIAYIADALAAIRAAKENR